jgi:hypothetical protein
MSDPIKHECGIAMIRLLKPLSFYEEKYGSKYFVVKANIIAEDQEQAWKLFNSHFNGEIEGTPIYYDWLEKGRITEEDYFEKDGLELFDSKKQLYLKDFPALGKFFEK